MYRSILVPLDGSTFGEYALPMALAIARGVGAGLDLVHIHDSSSQPVHAGHFRAQESEHGTAGWKKEAAYLARVEKRLASMADIPVTVALVKGPVVDLLQSRALATGAGLIVKATHGRGALGRLVLGSVADQLVRRTAIPVLLVRPDQSESPWSTNPGLCHVLIPLDGSVLAEQVLEHALALGSAMGADFTLLRVIKPAVIGNHEPPALSAGTLDQTLLKNLHALHEQERAEAQRYLDGVAKRLHDRSFQVRCRLVDHEVPSAAILDEAREGQMDLIAMGTHGRTGFRRVVLGSVAGQMLGATHVPVLVHGPLVTEEKNRQPAG